MTIDPIELLARLVEAKSLSGEEDRAADVVADALRAAGVEPRRFERNVFAERGRGARGLLFNSHLDTVPAAPGWTRDPWRPAIEGGRLYGLGASDAKSALAALLVAFVTAEDPGERGRLVFAATAEEEGPAGRPPGTGPRGRDASGMAGASDPPCRGLEVLLPHLGRIEAAVVGEPTGMDICPGHRGRLVLRLVAEGKAGHASRPHEGVNAIEIAAADVARLRDLGSLVAESAPADEVLGAATIVPTLIEGGSGSNVIPARCTVTLDVRTTPRFDNETARREIAALARSRVEVVRGRFGPVLTPRDSPIVEAARAALPGFPVRPFGGITDLVHLANAPGGPIPGVIIGPGSGAQSHQADEFVNVDAVRAAVFAYRRIASVFFESAEARP